MSRVDPPGRRETKAVQVLLVEDNVGDVVLLLEALSAGNERFEITVVSRLRHAKSKLLEHKFDVALLDLGLPDSHGVASLRQVRETAPDVPVIIMTGNADPEVAHQTIRCGASAFLIKGELEALDLVQRLKSVLFHPSAPSQIDEPKWPADDEERDWLARLWFTPWFD